MQYVNKYSAAFWGTSFVREMTRIELPAASSDSPAAPSTAHANGTSDGVAHPTVEDLKAGMAELKLKKEES